MTSISEYVALATRRATLKIRRNDLYETDPVATVALIKAERLPAHIWEPACGRGAIGRVLEAHGHKVTATDLVEYGYGTGRIDFLMERAAPDGVQAIITNPPFKLADQFVAHGLVLCPRVIMLLRLAFLESERRVPILDGGHLARVHVFRNRLPMMHRDGYSKTTQGGSSAIAFAWFVWDRAHVGPTVLNRISWEDAP